MAKPLATSHVYRLACLVIVLSALSGCADFWRNTYEGVRAHNAALGQPAGDNRPAMPDYDTYQREQDKLKQQTQEN